MAEHFTFFLFAHTLLSVEASAEYKTTYASAPNHCNSHDSRDSYPCFHRMNSPLGQKEKKSNVEPQKRKIFSEHVAIHLQLLGRYQTFCGPKKPACIMIRMTYQNILSGRRIEPALSAAEGALQACNPSAEPDGYTAEQGWISRLCSFCW